MNNIMNRGDLCRHYSEVEERSAGRVVPAIVTLVGIVLLVWASSLGDAENWSVAMFTIGIVVFAIGIVVFAIGIIKLIRPSRTLFYVATGEKVVRHFEGYEQEARTQVEKCLQEGNFEQLASLKASNSSAPLVSVTYSTASGSLRIGQLLHYVPYEYQPLLEPVIHKSQK